jgi:hypothetical protein
VHVGPLPRLLLFLPLADIHVSIRIEHRSLALSPVPPPLARVAGAAHPGEGAAALAAAGGHAAAVFPALQRVLPGVGEDAPALGKGSAADPAAVGRLPALFAPPHAAVYFQIIHLEYSVAGEIRYLILFNKIAKL